MTVDYDDLLAEVGRRKRARWLTILASEEAGRAPGRRPRDPTKEAILARLDRRRLEQRALDGEVLVRLGELQVEE